MVSVLSNSQTPLILTLRGPQKVSVLSGLNLEKMLKGFLSPGTKQTVRDNEVSVLRGYLVSPCGRTSGQI